MKAFESKLVWKVADSVWEGGETSFVQVVLQLANETSALFLRHSPSFVVEWRDTVAGFKAMIEKQTGVGAWRLALVHGGQQWNDSERVSKYLFDGNGSTFPACDVKGHDRERRVLFLHDKYVKLNIAGPVDVVSEFQPFRALFDAPVEVVYQDAQSGGKLVLNDRGIEMLANVVGKRTCFCVTMIGPYRSGKSFLLNQMFRTNGFKVSHGEKSETKGLWVWAGDLGNDRALLVFDTEGLGDPVGADLDGTEDLKRASIAVLVSSRIILNIRHVISAEAITFLALLGKSLGFFLQTDSIKVEIPELVLLIRDFKLSLSSYNDSPLEYLEKTLEDDSAGCEKNAIRKLFSKRRCFTLPVPVLRPEQEERLLDRLQAVHVRPEFSCGVTTFLKNTVGVETMQTAKKIGGQTLDGHLLSVVLAAAVKALNTRGFKISIPSLLETFSHVQSRELVERALVLYRFEMDKLLFPMDESELDRGHQGALLRAFEAIEGAAVIDRVAKERCKFLLEGRVIDCSVAGEVKGGAYCYYVLMNAERSKEQGQIVWTRILRELKETVKACRTVAELETAYDSAKMKWMGQVKGPAGKLDPGPCNFGYLKSQVVVQQLEIEVQKVHESLLGQVELSQHLSQQVKELDARSKAEAQKLKDEYENGKARIRAFQRQQADELEMLKNELRHGLYESLRRLEAERQQALERQRLELLRQHENQRVELQSRHMTDDDVRRAMFAIARNELQVAQRPHALVNIRYDLMLAMSNPQCRSCRKHIIYQGNLFCRQCGNCGICAEKQSCI
jgi:hypothetical protein